MTKILDEDIRFIRNVLEDENVQVIERLGGMTNRSYKIRIPQKGVYCFRIPGQGTEEIIDRKKEKISTMLACDLEIEPPLFLWREDGVKITQFIEGAQLLSAKCMRQEKNILEVVKIFKKLHTCNIDTGVEFEYWNKVQSYETVINKNKISLYSDYDNIKMKVSEIWRKIRSEQSIESVPCHNDPLCENWVCGTKKIYLIDWEYGGMNDPVWDLADLSLEAEFGEAEDNMLLQYYFGNVTNAILKRFLANKVYIDYLWMLWAKSRSVYEGEVMEQYANHRYNRLREELKCIYERTF